MANHRDGGLIVIGIDETTGRPNPAGLTSEQLATWAYDDVADGLTACSDPKISVEVETRSYHGRHFIVIRIHEFEEIPVLAKKDLIANERQVVRKGACYVRSLSKPETSEIPSQDEMRDLLDLAIQKGVRKFVQRAVAAGLIGVPVGTSTPEADAKFNAQLKDLR